MSVLIRLQLATPGNMFLGGNYQLYNVTSDKLGREFDPGKRYFSH